MIQPQDRKAAVKIKPLHAGFDPSLPVQVPQLNISQNDDEMQSKSTTTPYEKRNCKTLIGSFYLEESHQGFAICIILRKPEQQIKGYK